MVNVRSRSSWGARAPRSRSTTSWASRQEVTLHYSAGPVTQTPRQIQNFHMDGNGWADVGYNFLVDRNGVAYEGRGWTVVGAHAAPRNTAGIGICFIGRDNMTHEAKRTVVELYDEANRRAGRTLARKGHRDINSTSCPGTDNHTWWMSSNFRDVAGGGAPDGLGTNHMLGLRKGDSGQSVRDLQVFLRDAGHEPKNSLKSDGEYDGQYGKGTADAVLSARRARGSSVSDGDHVSYWAMNQLRREWFEAQLKANA